MALYYTMGQKQNKNRMLFADSKEKVARIAKANDFEIGTIFKAKDGWIMW